MTWLSEHQRIWRTAIVILLVVAFVGPWTGDRIHVPREYDCSGPYIRTEGDMCDMMGFLAIFFHFFSFVASFVTGTLFHTDLTPALLFFGFYFVCLVPFFTTLILIISAKGYHKFQIVAWGLAVGVSLLLGLYWSGLPSWMWGIRLYIWVAIGALLLELTAFVASDEFGVKGATHAVGANDRQ